MNLPSGNGEGECVATKCIHVLFESAVLFGPINQIVRYLGNNDISDQ